MATPLHTNLNALDKSFLEELRVNSFTPRLNKRLQQSNTPKAISMGHKNALLARLY
jgi:hypothetical protein